MSIFVEESSNATFQKVVDLPPSAKFLLYIMQSKGRMNRKALEMESLLPKRTVGSALTLLMRNSLIFKVPEEVIMQDAYKRNGKRADRREIYYETPLRPRMLAGG